VPCIVLDVPHQWSAWTRRVLISADEILIVAPERDVERLGELGRRDLGPLRHTDAVEDDPRPRIVGTLLMQQGQQVLDVGSDRAGLRCAH
jgi:hypothetical protein